MDMEQTMIHNDKSKHTMLKIIGFLNQMKSYFKKTNLILTENGFENQLTKAPLLKKVDEYTEQ